MEKVRYKKGKKEDFLKLESKDENIIYIINESGDFSESNMDDSAELYIGDKKIGGKSNMPIEHIVTSGTTTLNSDIKYMVKISGDTTFLLQYNNDTNNNHYYKIFLETEGTVPIIEFPSNVLWANEKAFLPNSKYIITIEDNILSYIKVEKPIYYSFSTAFSNDFKVFK